MAKFRNDNLDLETGEHIDFDDADTIQMGYDGTELYINSTISGVRAAQLHQMVRYDQLLEAVSGTNEFIELEDTPTTYSGYAGYNVAVRQDETGLEFTSSGVGRSGQYDIGNGVDYFTVPFSPAMSTSDYYLVGSIENQTDGEPAKYGFNISNTTVSGFDIELSDITDSANYYFNYTAVDSNVQAVGIPIPGPQGETGVSGIQGDQGIPGEGVTTTSGLAGQYDIPAATESFTVDFIYDMVVADYYVVGTVENQDDVETAKYGFNIVNTTLSGFGVDLSDITDSANYKFNWIAVANPTEAIGVPIPGPQGETGASGIQGEQGIQGEKGDDGVTSTSGEVGQYDIPNGVESFTVTFVEDMNDLDYYLLGSIENQVDVDPAKYAFNISNTTISGFYIELSDITDSANYKFNWSAVANPIETVGVAVPGPQGPQGEQGETGASGIQGEQGDTGASGTPAPTDHGLLTGLEDDDHTQYVPTDASRGFTSTVSGIDPTEDYHLATKSYIDDKDFLKLPASPAVNQTANGFKVFMTVDINSQGFGTPLYMASDGNLEDANASSNTTMPCVAMALGVGTGTKECCLLGFVRNDSWNWTSLGGVEGLIYVSTTSGILTQTLVSGSGQQVQVVGYATHADRMYFNPQLPMVELA